MLLIAILLMAGAMLGSEAPPIRILPMGDSITWGEYVPGGYRLPLFQLLTNAGYSVDFVGLATENGAPDLPDPDHAGFNGYRIDQLDFITESILEGSPEPDIILLLIGVNDFYYGYQTETAYQRLDALVGKIATNRPFAKLLVANLLEWADPGDEAIQATFNPHIPIICSNHQARGEQVYFQDLRSALTWEDTDDGLHPSQIGYQKMATNWFMAITNHLAPLGSTNAPGICNATGGAHWDSVAVTFSKPVADSATNLTNYSISGGLTILDATLDSTFRRTVTLSTSPQTSGSNYVITVSDVQDMTTHTIAPGSTTFVGAPLAGVFNNVAEAADFGLVYSLEIPNVANYGTPSYQAENLTDVGAFSRVGYYLELQRLNGPFQFVWVSMDPFTSNLGKLGVPVVGSGAFFQQPITNMNVVSSVPGIVNGTGMGGGNMEFWPNDYAPTNSVNINGASNATYDWGDGVGIFSPSTSGSMQLHNSAAGQVLFAFNHWGRFGGLIDLGIGNNSGNDNADWTGMMSAPWWRLKTLQVLALPVNNTNPPALVSVSAVPPDWTNLVLRFNRPLDDGATNILHYAFVPAGPAVPVVTTASLDSSTKAKIILGTTPLQVGTSYTLSLSGLKDRTSHHNPMSETNVNFVVNRYLWAGVNGNWTDPSKWIGNVVPPTDEDVHFLGLSGLRVNNDLTRACANLYFDTGAGSFTIGAGGGACAITGSIIDNSTALQTINCPVQLTGGATRITVSEPGGSLVINGVVSPTVLNAGLEKSGPGTLILANEDRCTGDTIVTNGTLALSGSGSIAQSPMIRLGPLGTLDATARTDGTLNLSIGQTLESGGTLRGKLAVNGTLALSGSGSIAQSPTIRLGPSGTLDVTARSDGTLELGAVQTFESAGTLRGKLSVNGTIAPGNSVGVCTNVGNVTLRRGGRYLWEMSDATGVEGSGWDLLHVDGKLMINAMADNEFVIDITSPGGLSDHFDNSQAYNWKIAHTIDGITGFNPAKFKLNTSNFNHALGQGSFVLSLANDNNDLVLGFSPPNTATPLSDQTVCAGGTATFSTTVGGPGPFTYQWRKNGTLLLGETNSSLAIQNVTASSAAPYCVVVSGANNSVTNCATLTVKESTAAIGPVNLAACPGTDVTFCTLASGEGPFSYQWWKGEVPLAAETNHCLALTNVSAAEEGLYCVKVTGACSSLTNCAALVVWTNTTTIAPTNILTCPGSEATFRTAALGTGPFMFQWTKDGTNIVNATNSDYTIASVTAADVGNYCVVVGGHCNAVTNCANLTLKQPVTGVGPVDAASCPGADIRFCTVASGTSDPSGFSYQWCKGELPLTGQTNDCFTLTNVSLADAGVYRVKVTGTCNSVTNGARLIVWTNTTAAGPDDAAVCSGEPATLNTTAFGTGPFRYQWSKDGTDLSDATNSSYTVASVTPAEVGSYCVVVSGNCNRVTNCATLRLKEIASATGPVDAATCPGGDVTFCTVASGSGPFTYQWFRNNLVLPRETNDCLMITNAGRGDAGIYCVRVAGPCNSVTNCATLIVWTNATASGPSDVAVCPGADATLRTIASGTGPFSYQWRKGDVVLDGQTNDVLTVTNVSGAEAGSYCVVISGGCNSITNCATITLAFDLIASGPDDQTVCPGSRVVFQPVPLGSGPISYQWSREGASIEGATNGFLIIANAGPADAGVYCVVMKRGCLTITNCATLAFLPSAAENPLVSVTNACPGSTVTFSLASAQPGFGPAGTEPCQWSKDGTDIPNATNQSYTISAATGSDSGIYCARVNGTCYSATLTVVAPYIAQGRMLEDGHFQLTFTGPAGQAYEVRASADIAIPLSNWSVQTKGTFGASAATFIDSSGTNGPARFFRILAPCEMMNP